MDQNAAGQETSKLGSERRACRLYTCLKKMFRYKEITCLVIVAVVTLFGRYGHSFHQKQITRLPLPPQRFFPSHVHVVDHITGSLQPVIKLLRDEELILVMYYAPWDAECRRVRGEFIQAAKVLSDVVKFVAVNCWWNEGDCRKRMKFLSFPELFMYHTGVQDGYRFTGPMEAEYFVRFVEMFIHPLLSLHNIEEIQAFTAQRDNTVIGYFDFHASPQPPGIAFHQFYLASLRVIAHDPAHTVRFGVVVSQQLATHLDLTVPGTFVLARTGNYTLKYPPNYNMTCGNITAWIMKKKAPNYGRWLVPPFTKSITLSYPLQLGPSVLLFAPMNTLFERNPYLDVIREAALSYYNCKSQSKLPLTHIIARSIKKSALFHRNILNLHKKCKQKLPENKIIDTDFPRFRTSKCCSCLLTGPSGMDQTSVCEYCVVSNNRDRNTVCDTYWGSKGNSDWNTFKLNTCSNSYQSYNVNEHTSLCCKQYHSKVPPNLFLDSGNSELKKRRYTDSYVVNGARQDLKRQCKKFPLQKSKQLFPMENAGKIIDSKSDFNVGNYSGLQCRTNKTVNFYILDNVYYSIFAERLGVYSPSSLPKEPAVILVDLKDDAYYVLRETFTKASFANFVLNYTYGSLTRHRRSSAEVTRAECDPSSMGESVTVTEVTANTFQEIVLDNNKDVMLLYYTPWCGFCSRFSRVYLTLAGYFQSHRDIVFARINADTNDLPWEFTVDTYPTILFFPAYRKAESIVFPEDVPKSLPNLVKFVLHHSNASLQIESAINFCSNNCVKKNIHRSLQKISSLEKIINRLQRRYNTLLLQYQVTPGKGKYIKMANSANRTAQILRRNQLRKAKLLNYSLHTRGIDRNIWRNLMNKESL